MLASTYKSAALLAITDENHVTITLADFYYSRFKLAVFVDGPPHDPKNYPEQVADERIKSELIKFKEHLEN